MRLSLEYMMNTPERQVPDEAFDRFSDQVVSIMQQAEEQLAQL